MNKLCCLILPFLVLSISATYLRVSDDTQWEDLLNFNLDTSVASDYHLTYENNGSLFDFNLHEMTLSDPIDMGNGLELVEFPPCFLEGSDSNGRHMIYSECGDTDFDGGFITGAGNYELKVETNTDGSKTHRIAPGTIPSTGVTLNDVVVPHSNNGGSSKRKRRALTRAERQTVDGPHTIQAAIIGDFSFWEKVGKDKAKASKYLGLVKSQMTKAVDRLPNVKLDVTTENYYTVEKAFMKNIDVSQQEVAYKYRDDLAADVAASSAEVMNGNDVFIFVTAKDMMGGVIGFADLGMICSEVISSNINEMGAGGAAAGTNQDALILADIAIHEIGHNLGMHHDFHDDESRCPRKCEGAIGSGDSDERGTMHYNDLNFIENALANNKPIWSICSKAALVNFIEFIISKNRYCLGSNNPAKQNPNPADPNGGWSYFSELVSSQGSPTCSGGGGGATTAATTAAQTTAAQTTAAQTTAAQTTAAQTTAAQTTAAQTTAAQTTATTAGGSQGTTGASQGTTGGSQGTTGGSQGTTGGSQGTTGGSGGSSWGGSSWGGGSFGGGSYGGQSWTSWSGF